MNKESESGSTAQGVRAWLRRLVWDVLTTIVPALVFALFINVYVAEAAMVKDGPSMQPNLYVGYRVMTEKISYRFHEPHRGDVVVVSLPEEGVRLIKRVVAVAGDDVVVRGGHVWIDGQPIDEPWVSYYGGGNYGPLTIPQGCVYVLGDNRANSRDSRAIGPVPVDAIEGRGIFVYWPLKAVGLIPH